MCIICNMPNHEAVEMANSMLANFQSSQTKMAAATTGMLIVSKKAATKEDRTRYARIHKRMVKVMRDWNRIEHEREVDLPHPLRIK